jgi:endonuclease/exonuclease/phosphatase (EEP) superfamily protein YafD
VAAWGMDFNIPVGAEKGEARFRLMTYNIKSYIALDDSVEVRLLGLEIARHDPDVLVMQDARDVKGLSSADREQLIGKRDLVVLGQYAIASRHPVRDCAFGNIDFRGNTHTYARCVLTVHGREVDLVTAHLLTPREGLNALRHERLRGIAEWRENVGDRLEQATALAGAVARRQRPLILAGDLNAPGRSQVMGRLREAGLRDTHEAAGTGYGYTYGHSHKFGLTFLRIDHVMATSEIGVVRSFPGVSRASPHLPVVADLHLDRIAPAAREPRS